MSTTPSTSRTELLQLAAALVGLAAVVALVAPMIQLRLKSPEHPKHSSMLAPLGGDGELVQQQGGGDAQVLLIDSTPDGAEVEIDKEPSGRTPVSTELHCPRGAQADVVVRAAGFHTYESKVACVPGTIVQLKALLRHR
jgi:hypothetical protein